MTANPLRVVRAAILTLSPIIFAGALAAQVDEPFDPLGEAAWDRLAREIDVRVEWIEVSAEDYTKLLAAPRRSADSGILRAKLGKMVEAGEAEMVETMQVVTRSGQRASAESIREIIYPTEYEPVRGEPAKEGEKGAAVSGFAIPTAFETRNVGSTVEVDPVIGNDGVTIDLNLAPELVYHVGDSEYGTARSGDGEVPITQPIFYTAKATTAVTMIREEYCHVATVSPPGEDGKADYSRKIFVIVRCDMPLVGRPADRGEPGGEGK